MAHKDRYSTQRINKDYSRREMKQIKFYITPEDAQVFKKKCADNDTSMQRVLESYIKQYIEESE